MKKRILIIGGYGGVGRALCRSLLRHQDCTLTIAGRSSEKAGKWKRALRQEFDGGDVEAIALDATDPDALRMALLEIDLAIVAATIPEEMERVARAALATQTDLMDILVRSDVIDRLAPFAVEAREHGLRFITQCGFHPGLIAPAMRYASPWFDRYQQAAVFMAMDPVFERPESTHEVLYETMGSRSRVLKDGKWQQASYRDAIEAEFPVYFGKRTCYPLNMEETHGLEQELSLEHAGVYAAGFGPYVDNFIFPLSMLLGRISKPLSQKICGWLFFRHIRKSSLQVPRVEFLLKAEGIKQRSSREICLQITATDGFELTAQCVVACYQQYLNGKIGPGLHLMGKVVDELRLFHYLMQMGVEVSLTLDGQTLTGGQLSADN